jgi:hypothetical protein
MVEEEEEEIKTAEEEIVFSIGASCYKCGSKCEFKVTNKTKYWICPKCASLNKCENLIKEILKDTVFASKVKVVEE